MNLGIDHALIAVKNLDEAIEMYQKLGFEAFYGGEHPNHGTHNALVPIKGGFYLEFIAAKDPELASQFPHTKRILGALERPNRYIQWALDTPDLDATVSVIRAAGIEIHDPIEGGRTRFDGEVLKWRTAFFEDPRLPFIIEDVTPRELRISDPASGLGSQIILDSIEIGALDVSGLSEMLSQIAGSEMSVDRGSIVIQESEQDEILRIIYQGEENLKTSGALGAAFEIKVI